MDTRRLFPVIALMACVLCSCGASEADVTTGQAVEVQTEVSSDTQTGQEKDNTEVKEHEGFQLRITTNLKDEVIIPDPAEASGVAAVTLYQNNKDLNMDNIKGTVMNRGSIYEAPTVSLPFLGLEKKVVVSNYAVGTIGEEEPQEIAVSYDYTKKKMDQTKEKNVRGNCLVLVLCDEQSLNPYEDSYEDEEDYDEDEEDKYAHLAVLDYKNGTSYVIDTGIYESQIDQLNLCDITGDGQEEMIVSGVANNWLVWQVFKLVDGEWKEIKSDYYEDDKARGDNASNYINDAFEGKVINDKTIKIWCLDKSVKFEQEIDVSDIVEREKKEYEKTADVGEKFPGMHNYDISAEDEAGAIYGYSYFQNINSQSGICYKLEVFLFGHALCGKLDVYMKYDKKADKLKISKVKFKEARDKE